jgi:glutamyl/glutaminyl-tRNA synthetase
MTAARQLVADEPLAREDFIIHRRDGLFAYNLAVVVDDHFQGVSEIVRGADLIEPTVRQISLYQHFAGRRRTISICRWPSMRRAINCRSKTTPGAAGRRSAPGNCAGANVS